MRKTCCFNKDETNEEMTICVKQHIIDIILTHLPLDKMAAILTDDIFKRIFLEEKTQISIKISLKFVLKGQINKIPALVQIMAWRRPGDKPLSEPMLTQFPDAYMRH